MIHEQAVRNLTDMILRISEHGARAITVSILMENGREHQLMVETKEHQDARVEEMLRSIPQQRFFNA